MTWRTGLTRFCWAAWLVSFFPWTALAGDQPSANYVMPRPSGIESFQGTDATDDPPGLLPQVGRPGRPSSPYRVLPAPNAGALPSRLTIAPFEEDLVPDGQPRGGRRSPFGSDSFIPTAETIAPPTEPSPLCTVCPEPPAASTVYGPLRSFIERWAPEGVVPYWGRRTPDWRKDWGIGGPLQGDGWRSQPFSISGFSGATNGGPLIRHRVHELPSYYGGVNFGWDYDHFWGIEKRLGFGALQLANGQGQRLPTGLSVTGEYRLMYYPLGDTRWRPFLTTGIGWSDFYFRDDVNHQHLDTLFLFPFGVGLKYLIRERLALRIDLIDELTLGSHLTSTFHYVALTAGLEFRYGQRLLRLPWHKYL